MKFRATMNIDHNNKPYSAGDVIEVDDEQDIAALRQANAIEDLSAEEAAAASDKKAKGKAAR
ncbi:MAG: hypothetical protein ING52_17630 [Burkholderiales bacterium]|jgi:hypothetical protein|nr:hypothetical protein [Burkholderiales bacterium]MCE2647057.1 hypothetical protein [Burkholderiaceae bacterium]